MSSEFLQRLSATLAQRVGADPAQSYVAKLVSQGDDAILKKIAEEAAETLLAAKDGDAQHLVREVADLWFHTLVLLATRKLDANAVLAELAQREGLSGLDEKAARAR